MSTQEKTEVPCPRVDKNVTMILLETLAEVGDGPESAFYLPFSHCGVSLDTWNLLISTLIEGRIIRRSFHRLSLTNEGRRILKQLT